MRLFALSLLTALFLTPQLSWAQNSPRVATPELASGRIKENSQEITTGDVLARTLLLKENLLLIHRYMGLPTYPMPLIEARSATMDAAFFNGLSIQVRIGQLAFEQLRSERPWRTAPLPERKVVSADIFNLLDASLLTVLKVKVSLGIKQQPKERVQPDTTSTTELFNEMLKVAGLVNELLERKMTGANAYVLATILVHQSMHIHVSFAKKMMPKEPDYVANKTADDLFEELMSCFALVHEIGTRMELPTLDLQRAASEKRKANINDVTDLEIVMIAELDRMIRALGLQRGDPAPLAPIRKYPSQALQRAKLFKEILQDLSKTSLKVSKK